MVKVVPAVFRGGYTNRVVRGCGHGKVLRGKNVCGDVDRSRVGRKFCVEFMVGE